MRILLHISSEHLTVFTYRGKISFFLFEAQESIYYIYHDYLTRLLFGIFVVVVIKFCHHIVLNFGKVRIFIFKKENQRMYNLFKCIFCIYCRKIGLGEWILELNEGKVCPLQEVQMGTYVVVLCYSVIMISSVLFTKSNHQCELSCFRGRLLSYQK